MPATTSPELAAQIVALYASRFLPFLQSNLVMAALINRDYEAAIQQPGDIVNVPIPPVLTTNNLAEGGTVQTQSASPGNAAVRLSNHREATVKIPDIVKALTYVDLMDQYLMAGAIAMAEQIEGDILALYPLFTNNTPVGGATAMDEARVGQAETALFNAKVPEASGKFLVVSGTTYDVMRSIPRFTENQTVGTGQPIVTGQLPARVKNFQVYRSQHVPYVSDRYHAPAFARDSMALVTRNLPAAMPGLGVIQRVVNYNGIGMRVSLSYDPNTLAVQMTIDTLYGVGVLRPSFVVDVQST